MFNRIFFIKEIYSRSAIDADIYHLCSVLNRQYIEQEMFVAEREEPLLQANYTFLYSLTLY